jgi:hypothetical protein
MTDLPAPAGATRVGDWEPAQRTGYPGPIRYFHGTRRTVEGGYREDIEIQIEGIQHSDGRAGRAIRVSGVRDVLSIADARQLARALMAAADEVDGWVQRADGTGST